MSALAPNSFFGRLGALYCAAARQIDKLQPLLLLAFRIYVARVFFMSGLTKKEDQPQRHRDTEKPTDERGTCSIARCVVFSVPLCLCG